MKNKKIAIGLVLGIVFAMIVTYIVFNGRKSEVNYTIQDADWQKQNCKLTGWSGSCTSLTYKDSTYYFKTDSFDEKTAENYVGKISAVAEYVDTVFPGTITPDVKVYVGFSEEEVVEKNDQVAVENKITMDSIWEILKKRNTAAWDAAEEYGLLYVYCMENGIIDEKSEKKEKQKIQDQIKGFIGKEENINFLDFNLPMIEAVYFNEEEADTTRLAVKEFAVWYKDQNAFAELEELCRKAGSKDDEVQEKLTESKNEWLKDIGSEKTYQEMGKIAFQYNNYEGFYANSRTNNTAHATYKIEQEDAIWLWDDDDVRSLTYKEMVENYMELEQLRRFDFAEAREYLKEYLPENLNKVKICTKFVKAKPPEPSQYLVGSDTIVINYGWADVAHYLLHEYVHHLACGTDKIFGARHFLDEWFPTLLETFELENRENSKLLGYYDEDYAEGLKELGYWDEKQNTYSLSMGRLRYTWKQHKLKAKEIYPVSVAELQYAQRAVMSKYIVDQYGLEKLVELVKSDGYFQEVFGKSFQDMYFEMIEWLEPQLEGDEWLESNLISLRL